MGDDYEIYIKAKNKRSSSNLINNRGWKKKLSLSFFWGTITTTTKRERISSSINFEMNWSGSEEEEERGEKEEKKRLKHKNIQTTHLLNAYWFYSVIT